MHEKGEGGPPLTPTIDQRNGQSGHSWYDRPHEELVDAFREYIDRRERTMRKEEGVRWSDRWSPLRDYIVEGRLVNECCATDDPKEQQRGDFFFPIYKAWQLLTYDRKDEMDKHKAAWSLSGYYEAPAAPRPNGARPDLIILTHPLQVKILDALTEAVGVPHQRGQSKFEIPKDICNYNKWLAKELAKQGRG